MWFKQLTIHKLSPMADEPDQAIEQLDALSFQPCLPSLPSSFGWVPPIDEDEAPLLYAENGFTIICCQFAEKILPATVVRQTLAEQIKQIETAESRKVYQKEKLRLKDEVTHTLLPRAFTKFSKLYAYIDSKNNLLILNSTSANKIESFIGLFKRTFADVDVSPLKLKKISTVLTQWLQTNQYPKSFAIEKACLLQDLNQQKRSIRCQEQNLTSKGIQCHLGEGFSVKQLAMSWHDRVAFVLGDDFSFRSLKYDDQLVSAAKDSFAETLAQQFSADFLIMTETLSEMLNSFLTVFSKQEEKAEETVE